MNKRTTIYRLLAFMVCICFLATTGHGLAPPGEPRAPAAVKVLLLVDDLYGGSISIDDTQNNILENFAAYGWEVSIAGCSEEVNPCPWAQMHGCEVILPDMMTYDLDNTLEWDLVVVAPGGTHQNLINCPFVLSTLSNAKSNGIPIAAWCRGVRVLAAADVISGIEITGHADYTDEYMSAGAIYLGNFEPPTADQGIITCINAQEYRLEMCELIRNAVESTTAITEKNKRNPRKIDLSICPNPIRSTSCIEFALEEKASVHIAVFDQRGKMVMDVIKQQFVAGQHRVTFSPASLPTGFYYVYLFSAGKIGMQKCMVI